MSTKKNKSQETYPLMEAIAVAVAVDAAQGFVKSGKSFYDNANDIRILDNRQRALASLRAMASNAAGLVDDSKNIAPVDYVVIPTPSDYAKAADILSHFNDILVVEQLYQGIDTRDMNDRTKSFNLELLAIFNNGMVDTGKDLAITCSLPNSRRVSDAREVMRKFYNAHRTQGFIGNVKERPKITGKVLDVKYIPTQKLYIITVFTTDSKFAKFFMAERKSIMPTIKADSDITFVATVKKQEVNSFTGCQETLFNRAKIIEIPDEQAVPS
jgi:hypothetical protein